MEFINFETGVANGNAWVGNPPQKSSIVCMLWSEHFFINPFRESQYVLLSLSGTSSLKILPNQLLALTTLRSIMNTHSSYRTYWVRAANPRPLKTRPLGPLGYANIFMRGRGIGLSSNCPTTHWLGCQGRMTAGVEVNFILCLNQHSNDQSINNFLLIHVSYLSRYLFIVGLSVVVGFGIYSLLAFSAKENAGPSVVLSFLIAAVASCLGGLFMLTFI